MGWEWRAASSSGSRPSCGRPTTPTPCRPGRIRARSSNGTSRESPSRKSACTALASHVAPARHPSGGRARRAPVAIAFLLLACARPLHAAPEGVMTWGVHVSLAARWLDPAETEGTIIPFMVLYALHDALVKPMPGGLYTPPLAESWTQSKDGLLYEFVLRKGVRFHNGDPVTAEDVKFSFER